MAANVVPMWKQLPDALNPLRKIKRWVIWRTERDEETGKETKPPFQSRRRNYTASTTREETWSTYAEAVEAAPRVGGGIGFVLGGPYAGLDLDNCRDPKTGRVEKWAQDILNQAGNHCYVEISPSGRGFHVIGLTAGKPLPNGSKIIKFAKGHVELYRRSPRYFTITGNQSNQCTHLEECDDLIDYVVALKPSAGVVSLKRAREDNGDVETDKTKSAQQIWAQVRHMMRQGKTDAQIFKAMSPKYGEPYKGDRWLREDIKRVREKFEAEPKPKKKPAVEKKGEGWDIVSSSAFLRDFVPPDYLIEGLLQRRFIYSLTGKTGSGKSAVTLCLAALIGRKFGTFMLGDHTIERGRVIYFAGENPDDIRIRWTAMLDRLGIDDSDLMVHFMTGRTDLNEDMDELREAVGELNPDLIVVDTARAYFPGDDENDNVQAGAYARLLRQLTTTGACVIVNCHPPKNATTDQLQPVGGGAFVAEVDGNLTCVSEDSVVSMHWQTKFRGPEFAPIQFELKEVEGPLRDKKGRKIKSVVASPMTEAKVEARASRTRGERDVVLKVMFETGEGMSLNAIAEKLDWKMANGRPYKSKVQRIVARLIARKLAHQPVGHHYELTGSGKAMARRLQRASQPRRVRVAQRPARA